MDGVKTKEELFTIIKDLQESRDLLRTQVDMLMKPEDDKKDDGGKDKDDKKDDGETRTDKEIDEIHDLINQD